MISIVEKEYIESLVATMRDQGYEHYLVVCPLDDDSVTSRIYFSKDSISNATRSTFSFPDGYLCFTLDSTPYDYYSGSSGRRYHDFASVSELTGSRSVSVAIQDTVWSNSSAASASVLVPDLLLGGDSVASGKTAAHFDALLFAFLVVALAAFFGRILRGK